MTDILIGRLRDKGRISLNAMYHRWSLVIR